MPTDKRFCPTCGQPLTPDKMLSTSLGPVPASALRPQGNQQLSPRQRQILALMALGLRNRAIGDAMDITEGTVKIQITAIFKALGVKNRTQAIAMAPAVAETPVEGLTGRVQEK